LVAKDFATISRLSSRLGAFNFQDGDVLCVSCWNRGRLTRIILVNLLQNKTSVSRAIWIFANSISKPFHVNVTEQPSSKKFFLPSAGKCPLNQDVKIYNLEKRIRKSWTLYKAMEFVGSNLYNWSRWVRLEKSSRIWPENY